MLFGFTNAPAMFMNIMNIIFKDYLGVFAFGFMDDIFMFSKNEEYKGHFEKVCEVLRRNKLYPKRKKCQFLYTRIEYLGQVMFDEGVLVDHEKIKIVVRCLIPKDMNEVRWFLGLVIYQESM